MKCSSCELVEDRDFIAALNPRCEALEAPPKGLEVSREKSPDEGPMNANPYGTMAIERQRVRVKFHEITLTTS